MLQRLDAVEERLAIRASLKVDQKALTDADATTGEQWDAGQVWAHLAEFIPYWIEQARLVAGSGRDEPVDFGRTKTDPGRIGAIERDRRQPVTVLWSETHADMEWLRRFLESVDDDSWAARGLHPTLGVMGLDRIVDEFLVGHLEEHADQLDALAAASNATGRR
jgi:hypothetical protein